MLYLTKLPAVLESYKNNFVYLQYCLSKGCTRFTEHVCEYYASRQQTDIPTFKMVVRFFVS